MSWYLQAGVNGGYPNNTSFPESYVHDWSGELPWGAWRLKQGVNDSYPFRHTWFTNSDSGGDGQMDIGGRQTNYPNGFSTVSESNINFDGNGQEFDGDAYAGKAIASMNNMYACKPSNLKGLIDYIKEKVSGDTVHAMSIVEQEKIREILGGNVYDTIAIAKLFPFDIPADKSALTDFKICSGLFTVASESGSDTGFHIVSNTCALLDFGDINIGISQGWEIETIDWSIYLPYCGIFPIDIRSNESINLKCLVDLVSGVCEYYLLLKKHNNHNGDIIFSTTGKMGADIPINLNAAKVAGNLQGWKNSIIGQGLQLGGTAAAMLFPGAGTVVGGTMQALGNEMQQHLPAHQTLTSPSFGGGLCFGAPTKARIIGRRPIIQYEAEGFPQLRGLTYEWKVDKVEEAGAGNYTEFRNYKCDIISATTEEKAEIEKLMNNGVFI